MAKWISLTLESGGQVLLNPEHLVSVQARADTYGLCRSLLTTINSVLNVRETMEDIQARAGIIV